jgi:hypothetical protein
MRCQQTTGIRKQTTLLNQLHKLLVERFQHCPGDRLHCR